jgi:hypothetical protein
MPSPRSTPVPARPSPLAFVVRLVIMAAVLAVAHVGAGTRAEDHRPSLPPCVEEDGSGGPVPCLWDGPHRGNGRGNRVVVTNLTRQTTTR